jgi:hypothetical protein
MDDAKLPCIDPIEFASARAIHVRNAESAPIVARGAPPSPLDQTVEATPFSSHRLT